MDAVTWIMLSVFAAMLELFCHVHDPALHVAIIYESEDVIVDFVAVPKFGFCSAAVAMLELSFHVHVLFL